MRRRRYAELGTPRQQQICEKLFKALTDKATDPRGVRRPTTSGHVVRPGRRDGSGSHGGDRRVPQAEPVVSDAAGRGTAGDGNGDRHLAREPDAGVGAAQAWGDEEAQSAQMYRRLADAAARHAVGEGSLWRDPDLQLALDWQRRGNQMRPGPRATPWL